MGEIQQKAVDEGLVATKYILGDMTEDGHVHVFYLRDDLPIATTTSITNNGLSHAHSIEEGPNLTVICEPVASHTHTHLKVVKTGDYAIRGLHTG